MKPRTWYRTTATAAVLGSGFAAFDGSTHDLASMGITATAAVVNGSLAWWWRQRIPPDEPEDTPHERCLKQIARLERELAADGVLFLMSQAQLDAQIDHAVRGNCPWCGAPAHAGLEQCVAFRPDLPLSRPKPPVQPPAGYTGPVYTMEQWLASLPRPGRR